MGSLSCHHSLQDILLVGPHISHHHSHCPPFLSPKQGVVDETLISFVVTWQIIDMCASSMVH